jgi:hypothetical protein
MPIVSQGAGAGVDWEQRIDFPRLRSEREVAAELETMIERALAAPFPEPDAAASEFKE